MAALSAAQKTELQSIIDFIGNAPEFPFDATVIERLAPLAVTSGTVNNTGTFKCNAKDFPIVTLLKWIQTVA